MADPKWVDASTIGFVADGDVTLRAELMQMRKQGPLLITPKVKEEITIGNPFKVGKTGAMAQPSAETARRCQQVLVDLDIKVDMMGSEADRRAFFETQFKFKQKGPSPVVRAMEESDAIILSQVAASAKARGIRSPTFFTADGRLTRNADAKNWGVALTARQSSPAVAGRGEGPIFISTATPGMNPGTANVALAGVLAVGALLNWLSDIITEERIRKDLAESEEWIRQQQRADPHMGILVVVELWQTVPVEASGYWPAPNYQGTTLIYGVNRATAEANLRRQWSGVPPMAKRVFRVAWIAPVQTAPAPSVNTATQAGWLKRYQLVKNAVDPPADYTEALHVLNGSSMYDIVNSLRMLASDRASTFTRLWQELNGPVPAFLRTRLPPAFSAVSDVTVGTGSIDFYKSRVGESFYRLSADDQKAIIEFMTQYGKKGH